MVCSTHIKYYEFCLWNDGKIDWFSVDICFSIYYCFEGCCNDFVKEGFQLTETNLHTGNKGDSFLIGKPSVEQNMTMWFSQVEVEVEKIQLCGKH